MSSQDLIFAVGGLVLAITVVPTLRSDHKPALSTSVALVVVLGVYTGVLASLDLLLGAAGTALQSVLWGLVVMQIRGRSGR